MDSRPLLFAFLAAGATPAIAQDTPESATITLADIRVADATPLKDRLLPAAIAVKVETGRVSREWLPGEAHRAIFREAPHDAGAGLCTMAVHSVQLTNPFGAPRDSDGKGFTLAIGPVQSGQTFAVRPAGSATPCSADMPYVSRQDGLGGEWQEAAYRLLLDWMEDARQGRGPEVALECTSEQASDCADPRAALAALPLETMRYLQVVNPRRVVQSEEGSVRVLVAQPIASGEPHEVTVALGNTGPDGRSWRISWVEQADGSIASVQMRRSTVIYH